MSRNSQAATAYLPEEQYAYWVEEAEQMNMSISDYICGMVEAGRKNIRPTVEPDETATELRSQRNDLKKELERTRGRVKQLEEQLHHSERQTIIEYVEKNPGCDYGELMQHLADTVGQRALTLVEIMEGEEIRTQDDRYYPAGDTDD